MFDLDAVFKLLLTCLCLAPAVVLAALTYYYHQELTKILGKPPSSYWASIDLGEAFPPVRID